MQFMVQLLSCRLVVDSLLAGKVQRKRTGKIVMAEPLFPWPVPFTLPISSLRLTWPDFREWHKSWRSIIRDSQRWRREWSKTIRKCLSLLMQLPFGIGAYIHYFWRRIALLSHWPSWLAKMPRGSTGDIGSLLLGLIACDYPWRPQIHSIDSHQGRAHSIRPPPRRSTCMDMQLMSTDHHSGCAQSVKGIMSWSIAPEAIGSGSHVPYRNIRLRCLLAFIFLTHGNSDLAILNSLIPPLCQRDSRAKALKVQMMHPLMPPSMLMWPR